MTEYICEDCSDKVLEQRLTKVGDTYVCDDCINSSKWGYSTCESCDQRYHSEELSEYAWWPMYCEHCYSH